MPLPNDEKIVSLANDLLAQFHKLFGPPPGFRPAHAKGLMLRGTFRPARGAASLTKAPHIMGESTPVTVRFSNSTGLPTIPDNSPDANPRGLAIRFNLAEHVHTDIVSHSTDGFPARDGAEFLEFLKAAGASGPEVPSPKPVERFLGSHPAALRFVQTPRPFPSSLARETYFGVTAFHFTNAQGERKYGRYRIVPEAGNDYLSDEAVARLRADYHYEELEHRVKQGPIRFKVLVQVAARGDVSDDATVHWPEDRELVELGTLELTGVLEDNLVQQKQIIFDPIPRVDGIEPSADPLLELRAAIYCSADENGEQRKPSERCARNSFCGRHELVETGDVILETAGVLIAGGGLYDLLTPRLPPNLASICSGNARAERLVRELLRALGGALLAIGATLSTPIGFCGHRHRTPR